MNVPEFHFSNFLCIFISVFVLECIDNGVSHKMNRYGKLLYIFPGALQYTTPVHYRGCDAPQAKSLIGKFGNAIG
jgi:hypothetical protein